MCLQGEKEGELVVLRSVLCNALTGEAFSGTGVFHASMLGRQVPHDEAVDDLALWGPGY